MSGAYNAQPFNSTPHLVLVKLPFVVPQIGLDIVPIFHDWMDNLDAVYGAAQFIEFVVSNVENNYIPFFSSENTDTRDRLPEIIKACYDVDLQRGAFNADAVQIEDKNTVLTPELVNPKNGVTFIDLREANSLTIKYCFFYADDNPDHIQKTPMSAIDFIAEKYTAEYLAQQNVQTQIELEVAVSSLERRLSDYQCMSVKELCDAYPEYMLTE